MRSRRRVVAGALTVLAGAVVIWFAAHDASRHSETAGPARVQRVVFAATPSGGAVALVDEIAAAKHRLSSIDLASGARLGSRPWEGPHDARDGPTFMGGTGAGGIVWVYSRDARLQGRAPESADVVVRAEHLAELHPDLAPRLLGEVSSDMRVDLSTGGLCLDGAGTTPTCPTIDPLTWEVRPVPRADLRLRTRTAGGAARTRTRRAILGPGAEIIFARTSPDRARPAWDATPTLVRPDGTELRMRRELEFDGGMFLVDPSHDEPLTVASPASVVVVYDHSHKVARLALEGRVIWSVDAKRLAPGEAEAQIHSGHTAGKHLVLFLGESLAAIDLYGGDIAWRYGAGAAPAHPPPT